MTDKRKKERRCNIIITRVEMDHRRETAHRTEQRGKEEEQTNRNRSMSGKEEESTFSASVEENERPAVEEAKNRLPSLSVPSFHPSSFLCCAKSESKEVLFQTPPIPSSSSAFYTDNAASKAKASIQGILKLSLAQVNSGTESRNCAVGRGRGNSGQKTLLSLSCFFAN